jgi:TonB family protein
VTSRAARPLASSVAAHLAALALCVALGRTRRPDAATAPRAAASVEVTFQAPPAAPAPPTPAPPAPAARPVVAARTTAARPHAAPAATLPEAPPAPIAAPAQPPAPVAPPAPHLDAMALMRGTRDDVASIVRRGDVLLDTSRPRPNRDLVALPSGTALERARAASAGYVRDRLDEAPARPEAPGVRTYYWHLRRRMQETWRPGLAREPSIGQTILATLGTSPEAQRRATELAMGAAARPGRMGSAHDALDAAQGASNSDAMHANPMQGNGVRPMIGIADLAQLNAQTTRAEIEVDQSEDGRVLEVRVLRSSRIASYDDAAVRAVREALPLQTPAHMPGGRRSRWSFQTVASRAPFVPGVGVTFDESSGWFEIVYPGRVTLRSRVWLESARPLST